MTERMGETLALALALEGRVEAAHEQTKQLVALASTLAQLPEPEIDAAFADALEQQLLTDGLPAVVGRPQLTLVTKTDTVEETTPRAPVVRMPRRRMIVRRSVASIAAAASLAAFPLVAAAASLPGSPFYGLKQWTHSARIAMFGTPVQDGFSYMGWANEKVDEATQLSEMPNPDWDLIATIMNDARVFIDRAHHLILGNTSDPAALTKLAAMARKTAGEINDLGNGGNVPPGALDAMQGAIDATRSIEIAVGRVLGLPVLPALDTAIFTPGPAQGGESSTTYQSNSSGSSRTNGNGTQGSELPKPDDRTPKEISEYKQQTCQKVGEAQLGRVLLKPVYDPTCRKPGSNI